MEIGVSGIGSKVWDWSMESLKVDLDCEVHPQIYLSFFEMLKLYKLLELLEFFKLL